MKKGILIIFALCISVHSFSQNSVQAKKLLDEVSTKMGAYKNMYIEFSSSLINEDAGIKENDELPIRATITLQGELYNLDYQGNHFIFDGKKLYVINHEEQEVNVTDNSDIEDDGFIYPSKLLTFYKEGYSFSMGKLKNYNGRKIQFVNLTPIDSSSEIVQVKLGVDARTKHIYKLVQIGKNGSETTFTINNFKSNVTVSVNLFTFDKEKYTKQNYTID